MRIAIISDSHGNVANFKKAVNWIIKENINYIFHAGDIGSPEQLEESLIGYKGEFLGVFGNIDANHEPEDYSRKVFRELAEINLSGKRFAIIHRPDRIEELAKTGKYDVIFHGHTHKPWEGRVNGCRILNPGELAGNLFKPCFAVYNTDKDEAELKILETLNT